MTINILYDKSEGGDSAFWQKSAADYFSGLTMGLFMDAKEKEVNLNSINFMSTVGEERRGTKTYIQEYFNLKEYQKIQRDTLLLYKAENIFWRNLC